MDKQLRHQIGQMIIAGFPSLEVDDQARALVSDYQVGNFILFARNMKTADQVAKMCAGLSDMTFEKIGLAPFISADQEGGLVSRITDGAALFPGALALAAGAKEDEIRQVGKNCGEMLRAMGINVNFAPVLDVNIEPLNPIIGIRSFGDDPQRVADLGCAMAEGMVEGGVIATLKHYPGHGNVATDSHLDLPTNETDPDVLEKTEFLPFKQAFDRGAPAIMSCHIRFPKIDPELPATLSPVILTEMLRKKQGFQGLVFTDCMEMDAIQKGWGTAEGAVLAVLAGCDVLCISHHIEAVKAACDAIYEAVQSGRIPRTRIQETYDRIVAAKTRMGLTHKQDICPEKAEELVHTPEKVALHKRLSRSSITLISGDGDLVKNAKAPLFLSPVTKASTGVEDAEHNGLSFAYLASKALGGSFMDIDREPDEAQREQILQAAKGHDLVVLAVQNARFRPGMLQLIEELGEQDCKLALVLLAGPWDVSYIAGADAVIGVYEYTPLAVASTVDALKTGDYLGKLPVKL